MVAINDDDDEGHDDSVDDDGHAGLVKKMDYFG